MKLITALGVAVAGAITFALTTAGAQSGQPSFSDPTRIDNPYMPLTAHRRCVMRGRGERSVKTLLDERRRFMVGGQPVDAVIIRDDAYEDGELVERTRDYFAQADDGTVYYLGEHVRNLRDGKLVDRDGTWLYGKDTDRLGVAMPADPQTGQQWRFEDVPGITIESDRVEETGLRAKVGGRIVENVIRIQEFVQPEGDVEYKTYAPGLGVIAEFAPDSTLRFAGCE
jgi:hypothetical protein